MSHSLEKFSAIGTHSSGWIRQASVALSTLLAFACPIAQAATRYWDGGTVDISANGDGNSDGVNGIWNTTLKNWDQGSGLPHVAWVNGGNVADINNASQTLTLGANIILGGIVQKSGGSTVAISGGSYTLTLNNTGANTFLAAANTTTGRTLTVNAVIAGGAGKNLVLAGPATSGTGTVELGSANTFIGTTSFSAGATGGARVYLNNRLALQNSTVVLSSDANLIFDSSVAVDAFTFGGLAADSAGTGSNLALRNNDASSSPIELTVGGNNSSTTYKGVLSGGGSLIKTGSGTLTFSAANTFTGTTLVSAGSLRVDGSTTSATTINNGANLTGDGLVNAGVTVNSGGSITPGANNLTVASLSLNGPNSINVVNLTDHTSLAALKVNNTLAISGGTGAVTINLPTALGFNGTYRLVQFGSGIVNANSFTLGTVPTLAWNQTGVLQISGGFLNYIISAVGDTTPPTLSGTLPINNATNMASADVIATFDETIVAGSGNIELRRLSDGGLLESFNVASSSRLTFSTTRLTINPTSNLATNQTYYVLIPAGSIRDTSGNAYSGLTANTGWRFTVPVPEVLFTDTGSPSNPLWSAILPTLNVDSNDPGPVLGSLINVNNAAVEVGLYGDRPISIPNQRIHVACHTSTANFDDFTRWFQTDGNTHVLRVFVNDENTATTREGVSSHTEAFMGGGWNFTDNVTYEWTARYTIARLQQGYCCFQLKNTDNDWAVQLSIGTNGTLTVNNRTGSDVVVTNPDGSAKNFTGGGFDVRVLDDGLNYRLWIDGVLYASSSYSRPTGDSTFRWGMYFGANKLNAPSTYNLILVSGAQVKSWPGNLNTATTTRTKANNSTNLNNGGSWVGGVAPGLHQQALWNSTVTTTNSTTLAADQQWAGLEIANPGGNVTLKGSAILSLDDLGVDMSSATRNLDVECPVLMTVSCPWSVGSGRTATFDGIISGYPGLTLDGSGTVHLNAANTYHGDTTVNSGTLVVNNNLALSDGLLVLNGGNLSNTSSCTLENEVNLDANANVNVDTSQTLTLKGAVVGGGSLTKTGAGTLRLSAANGYTGSTTVSNGTLALGHPSALLSSSGLTLDGGTLLQPNLDGAVITAPITLGGSGQTSTINAPNNNPGGGVVSTLTLESVITGAGNVTFSSSLNQNALSTVYLGAPSTYTGSTLLNTSAPIDGSSAGEHQIILKLGTINALPTTTVLTIDGGNGSGSGRVAELNLNGFDQQLAGLSNITREGTAAALRKQRVVNSNISAPATLTINNSSGQSFSGSLGSPADGSVSTNAMPGSNNGNNFGLTKNGAGTLTLSGGNSYALGTILSGGILSATSNNALGTGEFTFDGGTRLLIATGLTISNPVTIGSNSGGGGRALIEAGTSPGTATLSGPITLNNIGLAGGHFGAPTANTMLHVAGPISSTVKVQSRIGTVMYSGGGSGYSDLTVYQGTAMLGANHGISTDAIVTLGTSGASLLDLNGFNQSLAGVAKSGAAATVGNSSTTSDSTLTTTGSSSFAGNIQDAIGAGTRKVSLSVDGGILTLSGTNTYTGPSSVIAGTLELVGGSQTSAVIVQNGASIRFSLGSGTTSTKALNLLAGSTIRIGGTPAPPLNYTLFTTTASITGTPVLNEPIIGYQLQVDGGNTLKLVPAPTFSSWITGSFANGVVPLAKRGPNDDPDNDGISNLIEYALSGLDPTSINPPVSGFTENTLVFTKRSGTSGLIYSIEESIDLGVSDAWAEVTGGTYVNNASTISYTFNSGSSPKNFLRLKVVTE